MMCERCVVVWDTTKNIKCFFLCGNWWWWCVQSHFHLHWKSRKKHYDEENKKKRFALGKWSPGCVIESGVKTNSMFVGVMVSFSKFLFWWSQTQKGMFTCLFEFSVNTLNPLWKQWKWSLEHQNSRLLWGCTIARWVFCISIAPNVQTIWVSWNLVCELCVVSYTPQLWDHFLMDCTLSTRYMAMLVMAVIFIPLHFWLTNKHWYIHTNILFVCFILAFGSCANEKCSKQLTLSVVCGRESNSRRWTNLYRPKNQYVYIFFICVCVVLWRY